MKLPGVCLTSQNYFKKLSFKYLLISKNKKTSGDKTSFETQKLYANISLRCFAVWGKKSGKDLEEKIRNKIVKLRHKSQNSLDKTKRYIFQNKNEFKTFTPIRLFVS